MALSTLLQIVNRAQDELGLPRSTAVAASVDPQTVQLYAAANAAGHDLVKAHDWSVLQNVGSIATVDGTTSYALAADYDRMVQDTTWSRTDGRRWLGPLTPQAYRQLVESGVTQTSVNRRFRISGSNVSIFPTPDGLEVLIYEYVSKYWAVGNEGPASEFAADTDTTVFDPHLVKAEIKWRFMAAKGMFADGLKAEAIDMRDRLIAGDVGGTVLDMTPNSGNSSFITLDNVEDGSWS